MQRMAACVKKTKPGYYDQIERVEVQSVEEALSCLQLQTGWGLGALETGAGVPMASQSTLEAGKTYRFLPAATGKPSALLPFDFWKETQRSAKS
jgi:hypothetical protein